MAESKTAMGVYCSASSVDTNPAIMAVKQFNVDAVLNVKLSQDRGKPIFSWAEIIQDSKEVINMEDAIPPNMRPKTSIVYEFDLLVEHDNIDKRKYNMQLFLRPYLSDKYPTNVPNIAEDINSDINK